MNLFAATQKGNDHENNRDALRRSLGWRPTRHARIAAAVRGFPMLDVLLAAQDPEESWDQSYYAPGRQMRCRGDVAVVVNVPDRVIITVLWNSDERWTDEQAASRHHAS